MLWGLRGEAACGLGLHVEFGFHFSEGEAGDAENFLAGQITAEDGDGAARRGRPSSSARNSQSAAVARPSTGGAWTLTFRASPSQPHTTLRGALGMALIARVQEVGADAEGTEF